MRSYRDTLKLVLTIAGCVLWAIALLLLILAFFATPKGESGTTVSLAVLSLFTFGLGAFYIFVFTVTGLTVGLIGISNKTATALILAIDFGTYLFLFLMAILVLRDNENSKTGLQLLFASPIHLISSCVFAFLSKIREDDMSGDKERRDRYFESKSEPKKKPTPSKETEKEIQKNAEQIVKETPLENNNVNQKASKPKTIFGDMYILKEDYVTDKGDTIYKNQIVILSSTKSNKAIVDYKDKDGETKSATIPLSILEEK